MRIIRFIYLPNIENWPKLLKIMNSHPNLLKKDTHKWLNVHFLQKSKNSS